MLVIRLGGYFARVAAIEIGASSLQVLGAGEKTLVYFAGGVWFLDWLKRPELAILVCHQGPVFSVQDGR